MIIFVPLPPIPPQAFQPTPADLIQFVTLALAVFAPVAAIGIGLRFAVVIIKMIQSAFAEDVSSEKPKREPPVSFFEQPDTEPDEVVGFGDDGELIYASDKPKRKNDEVVE